jgi:methionyl aminopeptidase
MTGEAVKRICASTGCENEVTSNLACPKCKQFGQNAFFCTQDCFKKNYNSHKAIHALYQQIAGAGCVSAMSVMPFSHCVFC